MFFGIFSTILPYLIAAGFYLVWLLFNFASPLLQKTFHKDSNPQNQNIIQEIKSSESSEKTCFAYEDHFLEDVINLEDLCYPNRYPLIFYTELISYPPGKLIIQTNTYFRSGCFCRPPPAC